MRFHFRCVGIEERIVAVGRNQWRVTFAPLVAPDGSDNLQGVHSSFGLTVMDQTEARRFFVGEIYEFDIHTAPTDVMVKT